MIYLMPDTCIWISFLEGADLMEPLDTLQKVVSEGSVTLLTTQEILDEFNVDTMRQPRYARTEHRVMTVFANRIHKQDNADLKQAARILRSNAHLYDRGELVREALGRVMKLMEDCQVIASSDAIDRRVRRRIDFKCAPFHNDEKTVDERTNDAQIIEKFAQAALERADNDDYVFISMNKTDFARRGNPDEAHQDLEPIFRDGCYYTNNMPAVMETIQRLLSGEFGSPVRASSNRRSNEHVRRQATGIEGVRWFHRHRKLADGIADGRIRLHPGADRHVPLRPRHGIKSWRKQASQADDLVREHPGLAGDVSPYAEGFAAGAALALRWVMGGGRAPADVLLDGFAKPDRLG